MTQVVRVLTRLRRGPLTAAQALSECGIGRLGARVLDLRRMGHDIHTETEVVVNRFGEECRIGRYRLIREAGESAS